MHIPDSLVEKLLKSAQKATNEQLVSLREQAVAEKLPMQDLAIRSNLISEHDLTKLYAGEIDVPFVDLNPPDLNKQALALIPERISRQYRAIIFGVEADGSKLLAMDDPDDIQAINCLQKQLGGRLKIHIVPASVVQTALDQYRGNDSSELTKVLSTPDNQEEEEGELEEEDLAEDSPIAKTANLR